MFQSRRSDLRYVPGKFVEVIGIGAGSRMSFIFDRESKAELCATMISSTAERISLLTWAAEKKIRREAQAQGLYIHIGWPYMRYVSFTFYVTQNRLVYVAIRYAMHPLSLFIYFSRGKIGIPKLKYLRKLLFIWNKLKKNNLFVLEET